jgi:uncharacterized protein Yka (UPF0111/DUF47 family)
MNDDPLVTIKNINQMSKHIGKDIANNMGIPLSEFKHYIKPKEIRSIIKQYSVKKDEEDMINTTILQKIFNEVNNWVLGIQLCKMAVDNKLDSCWDTEQNCIIFEAKENKNG